MRFIMTFLFVLVLTGGAFAQDMKDSKMSSDSGGMSPSTSDNSMKGPAVTADPKMGNELRYAMSTGRKVIFTNLKAAETIAEKNPAVLFFAADWCPYCQADLKDINVNGSRLGDITVVVLNYDKTAALKTKYGVTVQDTFVQIDSAGKKLAIWNGGGVDGILSHVVRNAMMKDNGMSGKGM
jgi:thioredoxin 1